MKANYFDHLYAISCAQTAGEVRRLHEAAVKDLCGTAGVGALQQLDREARKRYALLNAAATGQQKGRW